MRIGTFVLLWSVVACSAPHRAVFRPRDRTFVPTAGATPRLYTSENIDQLRGIDVRSVGIIEVSLRSSGSVQKASEIAVDKGRQLGCWAVVEEAAFGHLQSRLVDGTTIYLAHGGAPHVTAVRPLERVVSYECVVRGVASQRADYSHELSPPQVSIRLPM